MKSAIYAGSFDPWSFGHQYVLNSALSVFDAVHVLVAVNPQKRETLAPESRACVIAHAIDPLENWWDRTLPFKIGTRIFVQATSGLVVDYAREQGIVHLIRGLRSTSDFEAEFNLYFSNRAIHDKIETWTIMCPPELLHCSSTYVRAVVGRPHVDYVGTSFLAQAMMLQAPQVLGELFDLIQFLSIHRFDCEPADLDESDLNAALQTCFSDIVTAHKPIEKPAEQLMDSLLASHIHRRGKSLRVALKKKQYPAGDVAILWAILFATLSTHRPAGRMKTLRAFQRLTRTLGKTQIALFDAARVEQVLNQLS